MSGLWISIQHWLSSLDLAMYGVWTVTISLLFAGLAGSVLPFVPGPLLIFAGCLFHTLMRAQSAMSWWGIGLELLLLIISYLIDFASGAIGSKWFGGSKWAVWGVIVGGIVGIFFALPGMILGPIIGAFAFEMLFAQKKIAPAAKSTFGSVVGTGVGLVVRLGISVAMIALFFAEAVWRRG